MLLDNYLGTIHLSQHTEATLGKEKEVHFCRLQMLKMQLYTIHNKQAPLKRYPAQGRVETYGKGTKGAKGRSWEPRRAKPATQKANTNGQVESEITIDPSSNGKDENSSENF